MTRSIAILGLAMCYCYYADRSQLFNKSEKYFVSGEFLSFCAATAGLGILSIRRSAAPVVVRGPMSYPPRSADQPFLSRDQTDEWKGWMQFIILIYHYSGASKVLWIYEGIRLLVACYIFMTGFGHTIFFYTKADYSLRRCVAVLIRLNMLSCVLPYIMDTDYLFYYFAPLVSFWYLVIYLTMSIGRSRNESDAFLIAKISLSAGLTTILIRIPGIFESVFYYLEKSCNIRWDVAEWRFRLQLDSYIVYFGMLCGIAFVHAYKPLRSDQFGNETWSQSIGGSFGSAPRICTILLFLSLPVFFLFAGSVPDKYAYNAWVPYVSVFPILCFVIFRNCSRHARNFYSSIFAWMGRHSLETFILQFHIWLAADTRGLLRLGVFERIGGAASWGRAAEFVVLTMLFFWVCGHVASATHVVTNWIIDPREDREDLDIEETLTDQGEELPRTKSKDELRSAYGVLRVVDGVGTGAMQSASRIKTWVAGDLRIRVAIILGIMWLLNVVSLL